MLWWHPQIVWNRPGPPNLQKMLVLVGGDVSAGPVGADFEVASLEGNVGHLFIEQPIFGYLRPDRAPPRTAVIAKACRTLCPRPGASVADIGDPAWAASPNFINWSAVAVEGSKVPVRHGKPVNRLSISARTVSETSPLPYDARSLMAHPPIATRRVPDRPHAGTRWFRPEVDRRATFLSGISAPTPAIAATSPVLWPCRRHYRSGNADRLSRGCARCDRPASIDLPAPCSVCGRRR